MSADRRYTITAQEGTDRTAWKCSMGCGVGKGSGTRPTFDAALAAAEAHHAEHHMGDAA